MNKVNNIPDCCKNSHRKENINGEEYNMLSAVLVSAKSFDPSTPVGAVISDVNGNIISLGCNKAPKGWNEEEFPYEKKKGRKKIYSKYPYVIHAEQNCLDNFKADKKYLEDSTLYVTLFPCNNCAKLIVESGIKKVVYLSDKYITSFEARAAIKLFENCGIEVVKFESERLESIVLPLVKDVEYELIPLPEERSDGIQRKRSK